MRLIQTHRQDTNTRLVDLNLLKVFLVLYEEQHVRRAGDRLNVTQSAVSHALSRLRAYFDDPLFVRCAGGLKSTRRADEIAPLLSRGFSQLELAVRPTQFAAASTEREFTISAPMYLAEHLLPAAIARAQTEAPMARFRIWSTRRAGHTLDSGRVDIALGAFGAISKRFSLEPLFDDELVWVTAPTVAQSAPHSELFSKLARVVVASNDDYTGVDDYVVEDGLRRKVMTGSEGALFKAGMTLANKPSAGAYDPNIAIAMAKTGLYLANVPKLLAATYVMRGELTILNTPDLVIPYSISALWRSDADLDDGRRWLLKIIHDFSDSFAQSSTT